jgi:hypothetical protein
LVPGGFKFQIKRHDDGSLITYGEVLRRLKGRDNEMISLLTNSILETGFKAVFWETVPISSSQLSWLPFEFVVLNAPSLVSRLYDFSAFAREFQSYPNQSVISFPNLGNDAVLVVPCPLYSANLQYYTHLASFLRMADESQRIELWRLVGEAMSKQLRERPNTPLWLSTSGLGVSWLHIRIDNTPKYYNYQIYKDWSFAQRKGIEKNTHNTSYQSTSQRRFPSLL